MTKFALALATAAGLLLAVPTFASPAAADPAIKLAQADVRISVGGDRDVRRGSRVIVRGDRHRHRHTVVRRDRDCSTTVVIRNGKRTVIKRCR